MTRMKLFSLFAALALAGGVNAQVSPERLLNAKAEPGDWLLYHGNYNGQRYTTLNEINQQNVGNLELKWIWQVRSRGGSAEKFEATPLVFDGVMYTVSPPNDVIALDPKTGRVFWTYNYTPDQNARVCCGRVNRGLAVHGDTLFMGAIDGHLLAIDRISGQLKWDVSIGDPSLGYALTVAPLVIGDKVIVGPAGGEYGIRGFIAAYDVNNGAELWRFNTIPGPGEAGFESWEDPAQEAWKLGGGSIWTTGSYDPELNLTYWGVGNPGPDWNGDSRPGDNLYTDSVVALNADTGELAWHYQFTPHDEMDYDATQVPVLADMVWNGNQRKVLMFANRSGVFYVIDRTTGEFLLGKPFVAVNWMDGTFDEKGRPNRVLSPSPEGTLIMPNNQGATNWYSPSYSPETNLFYVPTWVDTYSVYTKRPGPVQYVPGQTYVGMYPSMAVPALAARLINQRIPEEGTGAIQAIDPNTGEIVWRHVMTDVTSSGVLSTATNLVFAGGREGIFYALNARTGDELWQQRLGGEVASGPMSFELEGKQYVAISAGGSLFVFGLRE
ncbi:MAG: PQQ-dependent dehydrogenase, methanol/ethanol family [Pseudomonadales bacterium]|jgi:alcohol dehydrogenase (cytochrome c)|nr:PQQ-dependent dehydrogenase, methanol/ethanol family [Pseudomonadales bacterium]